MVYTKLFSLALSAALRAIPHHTTNNSQNLSAIASRRGLAEGMDWMAIGAQGALRVGISCL